MHVRMRERERGSMCVCEVERERESMCVCEVDVYENSVALCAGTQTDASQLRSVPKIHVIFRNFHSTGNSHSF